MRIETTLDYLKESSIKNELEHKLILDELKNFKNDCSDKYACKDVERITHENSKRLNGIDVRMAAISGGSIVAFFIVQLVLKHFNLV